MSTDQDQPKSKREDQEKSSAKASIGLSADSDGSDEDIIELTDLIKRGKGFENNDANFKFEQAQGQANNGSETILGPDDDNLEKIIAGLENELEMDDTEEPVSPPQWNRPIALDSELMAEEDKPSPGAPDETPIEESIQVKETDTSTPQPDETPMGSEEEMEGMDSKPGKTPDVVLSVSDEQIERVLTPMVREVIERTVRETVADVAERVIKEVIDSLKESIEPPRK